MIQRQVRQTTTFIGGFYTRDKVHRQPDRPQEFHVTQVTDPEARQLPGALTLKSLE